MQQKVSNPLFLGMDLGTSFIKISIIQPTSQAHKIIVSKRIPEDKQMEIISQEGCWAEQDPNVWWSYAQKGIQSAVQELESQNVGDQKRNRNWIKGIGISYQMHGLVLAEQIQTQIRPIRNSIIWCDGRTQNIGRSLKDRFTKQKILSKLINYPGNFTVSKIKWVLENEPELNIKDNPNIKYMLPGDFIAAKMTGKIQTTPQGLSESVLWDYQNNCLSREALQIAQIPQSLIPEIVKNFSLQSLTNAQFNQAFGFKQTIPIYYRSGDQPNNAYSLGVNQPGEAAASGGTSGTIYLLTKQANLIGQKDIDKIQRYNTFLHAQQTSKIQKTLGNLLCISGCGITYKWIKELVSECGSLSEGDNKKVSYIQLNKLAAQNDSASIIVLPFGNGPERMLGNINLGCQILFLDYKKNRIGNIVKAILQSLTFSFYFGFMQMVKDHTEDDKVKVIKVCKGNLFDCDTFSIDLATLLEAPIVICDVDGSVGAAKAGMRTWELLHLKEHKSDIKEEIKIIKEIAPRDKEYRQKLLNKYKKWKQTLESRLSSLTHC